MRCGRLGIRANSVGPRLVNLGSPLTHPLFRFMPYRIGLALRSLCFDVAPDCVRLMLEVCEIDAVIEQPGMNFPREV